MNEQQIRNLIRQEIQASSSAGRFGLNMTPVHHHTGTAGDGPRINSGDLVPGLTTTGSVTFNSVKSYTFNTNFNPTRVEFYGTVTDNGTIGVSYRSITVGKAALGNNLYFQPGTSSSVTTGGSFEIVQSCSSLVVNGGGLNVVHYAPIGEEHIIDVWTTNSSSPQARATVTAYGPNSFTVTVDTLTSGYSIVGNWFVS